MTTINNTTKKARSFIHSYNFYKSKNNGSNLYQIYGHWSDKKEKAFKYCLDIKEKLNGFDACFCGHNYDYFTYAFLYIKDNRKYLAYITYANDYEIMYD